MRITLNLATRPYTDLRPALKRLRIAMAVLAVAAIGLGLGLRAFHQQAEEARATEERVQSKIDAINRERQGYQNLMRQPANDQLLRQAAELNQLFDEKTFSWTLAMEDLETVLPGRVQVTAIDPTRDAKTGSITMKLRIVGPRDKADDLVQNLEHSRYFVAPHIVSESTDTNGGQNQRLDPVSASNRFTFELLADYNTAVALEHRPRKVEKPETKAESARQKALPVRIGVPQATRIAPVQTTTRPPFSLPNRTVPNAPANVNRVPIPVRAPNPNTPAGGPR
ncbi:MAG: hypothetical protein ABSB60_04610 [Terracidiphilus sp.]|jgi:type IV pilus assembly protein PilN